MRKLNNKPKHSGSPGLPEDSDSDSAEEKDGSRGGAVLAEEDASTQKRRKLEGSVAENLSSEL
jgi:hypothetical protein